MSICLRTFSRDLAGLDAGMNLESLIEAADAAMYEAKKSGHSRVLLAHGSGFSAASARLDPPQAGR